MRSVVIIISILLLTFLVPLGTSMLLDLSWITAHKSREVLVLVLMLGEFAIGVLSLKQYFNGKKN